MGKIFVRFFGQELKDPEVNLFNRSLEILGRLVTVSALIVGKPEAGDERKIVLETEKKDDAYIPYFTVQAPDKLMQKMIEEGMNQWIITTVIQERTQTEKLMKKLELTHIEAEKARE